VIYVVTKDTPAVLFVLLCEADISERLRPGNTLYVDPSMVGGLTFGHVVLSLGKTDQANIDLLKKAHPEAMRQAPHTKTVGPGEERCAGCKGVMPAGSLFEGTCTVCWATEAKTRRKESN
jgi:hypothetical protein